MKTNIIIETKGATIQKMWIPELQDINNVIEQGKRELLEKELLEIRNDIIEICWTCGEVLSSCICKKTKKIRGGGGSKRASDNVSATEPE